MKRSNSVLSLKPVPSRNILIIVDENHKNENNPQNIYMMIVREKYYMHISKALNNNYLSKNYMRIIKKDITNNEVMSETIIFKKVK